MKNLFKKLFTKHQESQPSKALLDLKAIQERNKERMEAIKEQMGNKYIMHKSHMKTRLSEPRPV